MFVWKLISKCWYEFNRFLIKMIYKIIRNGIVDKIKVFNVNI